MLFLIVSLLLTFTHTGSHQPYCVVGNDGSFAMLPANNKVDAMLHFWLDEHKAPIQTWQCSS